MVVGFWSGLISALMVFLWFTLGYLPAFVPGLPGFGIPANHGFAAVEIQEAVGTALVIGHWHVLLSSVFSVIGGVVGGLAGILLARTGRGSHEPRRILWSVLAFCLIGSAMLNASPRRSGRTHLDKTALFIHITRTNGESKSNQ
jgi:hypothetical protein